MQQCFFVARSYILTKIETPFKKISITKTIKVERDDKKNVCLYKVYVIFVTLIQIISTLITRPFHDGETCEHHTQKGGNFLISSIRTP